MNTTCKITIIIKTFERPKCLRRLLQSIARLYPEITVLIADDSHSPYAGQMARSVPNLQCRVYDMPFDSGVSAGRNLLLQHVKTPFFVHCDDDFIFDERTDLYRAVNLLQSHDLDILGGLYYNVQPLSWKEIVLDLAHGRFYRLRQLITKRGIPHRFMGNFIDKDNGTAEIDPIDFSPPVTECDLVQNFFIARTICVRDKTGGWNEEIKIGGDHEDFFYRASRAGLRIGHTEPFGVVHFPERPSRYARFRARASWIRPAQFGKWMRGMGSRPADNSGE